MDPCEHAEATMCLKISYVRRYKMSHFPVTPFCCSRE